jgi:hypothetical protein
LKLWSVFGLLFADSDHFDEELNTDPHQSEMSDPDPDPDPYQSENPDSNPDPQHCTIECFAINEWIDFSLITVCRHY